MISLGATLTNRDSRATQRAKVNFDDFRSVDELKQFVGEPVLVSGHQNTDPFIGIITFDSSRHGVVVKELESSGGIRTPFSSKGIRIQISGDNTDLSSSFDTIPARFTPLQVLEFMRASHMYRGENIVVSQLIIRQNQVFSLAKLKCSVYQAVSLAESGGDKFEGDDRAEVQNLLEAMTYNKVSPKVSQVCRWDAAVCNLIEEAEAGLERIRKKNTPLLALSSRQAMISPLGTLVPTITFLAAEFQSHFGCVSDLRRVSKGLRDDVYVSYEEKLRKREPHSL